ncbi:MAG: hypothetical protein M3464_09685 [Chloroflexota bacterium]|nr:hypothetical protein [Pseudomonadota bacterium]MDQ3693886.1 hypothetical protein [Chloroflexota bacterium]
MVNEGNRIKTEISPDFLDTIGKSFKFKHAKGIAELLKNSLDQYLRLRESEKESRNGNWPVFLCLMDASSNKRGPNLAVIDFGGTTLQIVESYVLNWGSRSAASHGGSSSASVTGGHGNGGKFYMREMWKGGARFITWRDGRATSLVVDRRSDGTTGVWEIKDRAMSWRTALATALPKSEGLGGDRSITEYLEHFDGSLVAELDSGGRELQLSLVVRVSRCCQPMMSCLAEVGITSALSMIFETLHKRADPLGN